MRVLRPPAPAQIGLLYQAMQVSLTHESGRADSYDTLYSPEFKLKREAVDKIFWENAEGLMQGVHHPYAGESCDGYSHAPAKHYTSAKKQQQGGGAGSPVSVASVGAGSPVSGASVAGSSSVSTASRVSTASHHHVDPGAKAVIAKQ